HRESRPRAPVPRCGLRRSPPGPQPGSVNRHGTRAVAPRARSCSRQSRGGSRTLPAAGPAERAQSGRAARVGQEITSTRSAAGDTVRRFSRCLDLPSPDSGQTTRAAVRVAVLVLVVLALRLPINDLPRYFVLLIGSIAIFASPIRL